MHNLKLNKLSENRLAENEICKGKLGLLLGGDGEFKPACTCSCFSPDYPITMSDSIAFAIGNGKPIKIPLNQNEG